MVKIKSWPKLIFSIILSQSAGLIGTFFTIQSIPTWYATLEKPFFNPPNYIFGPVWTILYTLIGISLYLILTHKKKGSLKLFWFHLLLNALWSPIFFGLKNLGLALFVIIVMDVSLVLIIKNFYKVNKWAAYLLIPYLLWISFASILNFSIWQLNFNLNKNDVYAQDFNFSKAKDDFVFVYDNYKEALYDFNLKKDSYNKNKTLSLKEEFRISTFKFINNRNTLIKSYLTMIRMKALESKGISESDKQNVYSKIDPEVEWYTKRTESYNTNDTLEDLISKSKEEDNKYQKDTDAVIRYSILHIGLGDIIDIKDNHQQIYNSLNQESKNLVSLGRANEELFTRWFNETENEINITNDLINKTKSQIETIFSEDVFKKDKSYQDAQKNLEGMKVNLLKLNNFIFELETVISDKR